MGGESSFFHTQSKAERGNQIFLGSSDEVQGTPCRHTSDPPLVRLPPLSESGQVRNRERAIRDDGSVQRSATTTQGRRYRVGGG